MWLVWNYVKWFLCDSASLLRRLFPCSNIPLRLLWLLLRLQWHDCFTSASTWACILLAQSSFSLFPFLFNSSYLLLLQSIPLAYFQNSCGCWHGDLLKTCTSSHLNASLGSSPSKLELAGDQDRFLAWHRSVSRGNRLMLTGHEESQFGEDCQCLQPTWNLSSAVLCACTHAEHHVDTLQQQYPLMRSREELPSLNGSTLHHTI